MNWLTPTRRKWLMLAAKLLIVGLVVWFIGGTVLSAMEKLSARQWALEPRWLAACAAFYVVALVPEGLFWFTVLRALGQPVALGRTLRAYFIGHLGKYVPGKAMVVVLRTGLIRGPGVHTGIAVASVFLETLTMMAVGACLAAGVLAIWCSQQWQSLAIAVVILALSGIPTLPPVFSRVVRLAGVGRSDPAVAGHLAGLNWSVMLGGWVLMAAGWVLMGASLWAALRGMGLDVSLWGELHFYTAAVAMAVVGGFASMIPGGLGVREALLIVLLEQQLGDPGAAVIVTAVTRLVWLAAELAVCGVVYPMGRRATGAVEPLAKVR